MPSPSPLSPSTPSPSAPSKIRLRGLVASMVTPFGEDGTIDLASFERLCEELLEQGVDGLFVSGTTGEGLLLEEAERVTLVRVAALRAEGRVPVCGHAGQLATVRTAGLARAMVAAGADAVAAIVPYFYPVSDEAVRAHVGAIATAAGVPTYLYSIPSLTHRELPAAVLAALTSHPHLGGLKYTGVDFERLSAYVATGADVLVGGDALVSEALRRGAVGTVSGLGGALPGPLLRLFAERGAGGDGRAAEPEIAWLASALAGLPPVPALKWILWQRGILRTPLVRAPLEPLAPDQAERLAARLRTLA